MMKKPQEILANLTIAHAVVALLVACLGIQIHLTYQLKMAHVVANQATQAKASAETQLALLEPHLETMERRFAELASVTKEIDRNAQLAFRTTAGFNNMRLRLPKSNQMGDEAEFDFSPELLEPEEFGRPYDLAADLDSKSKLLAEQLERTANRLRAQGRQLQSMPTIMPAIGVITSRFGKRHSPFKGRKKGKRRGKRENHFGIDIATKKGAPVVATASGVVVESKRSRSFGKYVVVDHGQGITTFYAHNSKLIVKPGQQVRKGQAIAYVGSTGRSTGPHLHYEVRFHGGPVDPEQFLTESPTFWWQVMEPNSFRAMGGGVTSRS